MTMMIPTFFLARFIPRSLARGPREIIPLDVDLLVSVAGGYKMQDDGQGCTGPYPRWSRSL